VSSPNPDLVLRAPPASQGVPPPADPDVPDPPPSPTAQSPTPPLPTAESRASGTELSAEQQRELAAVLDALHCPVRQQILLALAAARQSSPEPARQSSPEPARQSSPEPARLSSTPTSGDAAKQIMPVESSSDEASSPKSARPSSPKSGGRVHVGGLAERTGVSQKTLSHHLDHLRTAGLVFSQRSGKCIEYEAAEDRVRYERHADGHFSITVTADGGGVSVTITVGGPDARGEPAEPACGERAEPACGERAEPVNDPDP
jgi:DNA-binding transcriptional ArsR family regulator